jgi:glycosyltransferase involved in cell wall biosynthesis
MAVPQEPRVAAEQDDKESSKRPLLFSVIIPVRNEEKNVAKCLASLGLLQFPPQLFEVIVVDNGSTDGTRDVASIFRDSLAIRILERPNVYISALRNIGASIARGQCLAFLDADCEVRTDWLEEASRVLSEGTSGVFGSSYLIPEGSSWVARYWHEDRDKKGPGAITYIPSGDLFMSRGLFQNLHGFDETLQTNEDYEFCQRVRASGFPITCVPELGVIHWGTPQSLNGFFRKHRWHGTHVFRVFLRSLPALYNFKAMALALYTAVCLLGLLASVVFVAETGQLFPLGGFLAALLAPAVLLGVLGAVRSRRLGAALPLAALYLTYALARASCLLDRRSWFASGKSAEPTVGQESNSESDKANPISPDSG